MIQHSYKLSDCDLPDLAVTELLKLTHYIQVQKVNTTCFLSLADSDLNLRQTSKFYLQRRKGASNVSKSEVLKSKPLQHGKEFPTAKSAISKHTFDKHTSHQAKEEAMSNMSKIDEAKSNEESSKSEGVLKSKRQKVEKIPSKKSSEVEKASSQSLKEFQKDCLQQFQDHLTNKTAEKILLSEFMQTNKSKAVGDVSPKSSSIKPSKTEKCAQKSHLVEPSHQPYQSQQHLQTQQKIPKEEDTKSISSNLKYPKSALKVTPQKQANRSKGKSKTKTPKQSSFYKPSIKITGSEVYGPQKIQAIPSQAVFNDYSSKDNRHPQKKTIKQTNIFKKKINIKCQERIPVELLPSSPQSQSPDYKESQLDEKYYEPDYNKYNSHLISQVERQPLSFIEDKDKQEADKSYMDFYAIDISPCKAKGSHQEKGSMDMIELPSSLASKLKQEETQKTVIVPESEAASKPSKSSRKKIFEVLPSKPAQQPPIKPEAQPDSLNDQQLRMLLGVKGNKYKQAIVMQYIKDNRRLKVK